MSRPGSRVSRNGAADGLRSKGTATAAAITKTPVQARGDKCIIIHPVENEAAEKGGRGARWLLAKMTERSQFCGFRLWPQRRQCRAVTKRSQFGFLISFCTGLWSVAVEAEAVWALRL